MARDAWWSAARAGRTAREIYTRVWPRIGRGRENIDPDPSLGIKKPDFEHVQLLLYNMGSRLLVLVHKGV